MNKELIEFTIGRLKAIQDGRLKRIAGWENQINEERSEIHETIAEIEGLEAQLAHANLEKIEVGDLVRSHDFPEHEERIAEGRKPCYVEGEVVGIEKDYNGVEMVMVFIRQATFGGKADPSRIGKTIRAPQNGLPTTFGRVTDYLEILMRDGVVLGEFTLVE